MSNKMKILMININDIKEYENNPRNNEPAVEAVANSIKSFGFKVPIIIDKNNVIVAGHTRLRASRKLGYTEVPCVIADDLTEEQTKAFRLADNKTAELAEWNLEKLTNELQFIEMDMEQFGFEDLEKELEKDIVEDNFDENEELPINPYAKKGDIFILGKHRLMCGDSTKNDNVKTLMDGKLADMIMTDPPYNVDYTGTAGKIQNDKQKDEDFYIFLRDAFTNMSEVSKAGAAAYIFHADVESFNFLKALKEANFKLSNILVWVKNNFVFGRKDYHSRHEMCFYSWKLGGPHYFIDDRTQDTVWEFDKPKSNNLHPTMKPVPLLTRAIKNSSRTDDLVLDLFGGSGSTLIACEQILRRACLMEIDERFVDVIVKRYLRFVQNYDGCYLIRDGKEIPLNQIPEYSVEFEDLILQ